MDNTMIINVFQIWNLRDDYYRPYIDPFRHNANKIINVQQNFNNVDLKGFVCDRSGKMYPDPETQCQVIYINLILWTYWKF